VASASDRLTIATCAILNFPPFVGYFAIQLLLYFSRSLDRVRRTPQHTITVPLHFNYHF
jgi:hypothetical protein